MAGKKRRIEYELALTSTGFTKKLELAQKKLSYTAKKIAKDFAPVTGIFTSLGKNITYAAGAAAVAATAGGFYALQSVLRSSVVQALELDRAMYNMGASLTAANRQFDVGSVQSWEQTLKRMSAELRVFSETDLRNASARTIDMTKRLGLSEEQMGKVMTASANLGAGKFKLVDSVERVTAALRGEAEASEALGLTLNETYVKAWHNANNATGKAWKDLTDLEKAQVRYNVLLEQAAPSAGRAADSYNTMSGASAALASSYSNLLSSIGEVVTKNRFFVESVQVIDGLLKGWQQNIEENRQAWMVWSKQSALSVLEFAITFADGMDDVYRALQKVSGILSLSWAGTVKLGQGFQYLFEQSNKFFGDDEKAKYWADAQKDSAAVVEKALAAADNAFKKSDTGLSAAKNAAAKIKALRDQLAQIEVQPVADSLEKVAEVSTATTEIQLDDLDRFKDAQGNTWREIEGEATDSINAIYKQLQELTDKKWTANVDIKTSKSGKGYATGGTVRGPGGVDNVPAWLTAGEFVIRRQAVARLGTGFLNAINSLQMPEIPMFANGGQVGAAPAAGHYTHDINFPGAAAPVRVSTDPANAVSLIAQLERMGALAA